MHNYFEVYYFIDKFNLKELSNIKRKINIIFRDYSKKIDLNEIIKIQKFCKQKGFNLYLSNNTKLAIKLNLDGVYLPSFNKKMIYKNVFIRKNFKIIGSAHNLKELKIKENQNCERIFISPIFKTNKNKTFIFKIRFNLISNKSKKKLYV